MARSPGGRCALLLLAVVSAVTPRAPAGNTPGVPRGGTALGPTCGEPGGQNSRSITLPLAVTLRPQ